MPLARLDAPFDHPDWIFELKYDGFRDLAYVEDRTAWLVSRKGNVYKSFPDLAAAIAGALPVRNAILDGEIVPLAQDGVPQFYDLLRRANRSISTRSTCCRWTVAICTASLCSHGKPCCAASRRGSRPRCCTWTM